MGVVFLQFSRDLSLGGEEGLCLGLTAVWEGTCNLNSVGAVHTMYPLYKHIGVVGPIVECYYHVL